MGLVVLKSGVARDGGGCRARARRAGPRAHRPGRLLQGGACRRAPAEDALGQDPARHPAPHRRRRAAQRAGDDRGPRRARRDHRGSRHERPSSRDRLARRAGRESPGQISLGFIGIGIMGTAMVLRLLERGWRVTVWNKEPERLPAVCDKGAIAAATPREVAAQCDMLLLCVLHTEAVNDVIWGADGAAEAQRGARSRHRLLDDPPASDARLRATPAREDRRRLGGCARLGRPQRRARRHARHHGRRRRRRISTPRCR